MKPGDVVVLASGSGPMTVVAVNDDLVTCAWFEACAAGSWKGSGRATFPRLALVPCLRVDAPPAPSDEVQAN